MKWVKTYESFLNESFVQRFDKANKMVDKVLSTLKSKAAAIAAQLVKFEDDYIFSIDGVEFNVTIDPDRHDAASINYDTLDITLGLAHYFRKPKYRYNLVELAYNDGDFDKDYVKELQDLIETMMKAPERIWSGEFVRAINHEVHHLFDATEYGDKYREAMNRQLDDFVKKFADENGKLPQEKYHQLNAEINTHLNTALNRVYNDYGDPTKHFDNLNDFIYFILNEIYPEEWTWLKMISKEDQKRVYDRIAKFWNEF